MKRIICLTLLAILLLAGCDQNGYTAGEKEQEKITAEEAYGKGRRDEADPLKASYPKAITPPPTIDPKVFEWAKQINTPATSPTPTPKATPSPTPDRDSTDWLYEHNEDFARGYDRGYDEAWDRIMEDGGYDRGYEDGYDEGYREGYRDAMREHDLD